MSHFEITEHGHLLDESVVGRHRSSLRMIEIHKYIMYSALESMEGNQMVYPEMMLFLGFSIAV
jgi:hypothetical protein